MSTELVPFDYAELDVETRIVVRQRTDEIKTLVRRSAQDIIDIGNKLIDVKEKLNHGEYGNWLEREFGWSWDTASRFMNVALHIRQIPHGAEFQAKALYLLAAPSTPEPARLEAIERAKGGERITHTVAQTIVADHKPKPRENAAIESEITRLHKRLVPLGWGAFYDVMPKPCYVSKGATKFPFSNRDDKPGELAAWRQAKAHEEAQPEAPQRTYEAALPTIVTQPAAAPSRTPMTDHEVELLIRQQISLNVKPLQVKGIADIHAGYLARLEWLRAATTQHFVDHTPADKRYTIDQFSRAYAKLIAELTDQVNNAAKALAAQSTPSQPTPGPRPLTDDEAKVVLWRVIEHHVKAIPGTDPEYHLAAQLRWFKSAPFQLFKDAINASVTMSDEQFVRLGQRVEAELTLRLAQAKQKIQPTTFAPPRLTSLTEVLATPDDGTEEEFFDDEEVKDEEENTTTVEVVEEQAPLDNDEYYTPAYIVEPSRQVLGTIDLDPASCVSAQRVIQAEAYFTKADDGLSSPWYGTVWLNPPYSNPFPWIEKLFAEYNAGRVTAAMVLVNTANSPKWARLLWQSQGSVCLLSNRLKFWRSDKPEGKGFDRDQMIWYLGPNTNKFRQVFSAYGAIR